MGLNPALALLFLPCDLNLSKLQVFPLQRWNNHSAVERIKCDYACAVLGTMPGTYEDDDVIDWQGSLERMKDKLGWGCA